MHYRPDLKKKKKEGWNSTKQTGNKPKENHERIISRAKGKHEKRNVKMLKNKEAVSKRKCG